MSDNKKVVNNKQTKQEKEQEQDEILKEIQDLQKQEVDELTSSFNNKRTVKPESKSLITKSKCVIPKKSNKCYLKRLNKLGNKPMKFNTTYKKPLYDDDKERGDITDTYKGEWNGPNNYSINHTRVLNDKGMKCHTESHIFYNSIPDKQFNEIQKDFDKALWDMNSLIEDDFFDNFLF